MAKKNETIPIEEKLKNLFVLQRVDTDLDQIEILKGELPMEVRDLEDELTGLQTRINKLNQSVEEVEKEISGHEGAIAEANSSIERYKTQLNDVRNDREFQALNKEIELQSLDIQLAEKRIREARRNIEIKKESLENANERHVAKASALEAKKVELETIIAKTEKDEEKLIKKSERARKKIETRLLDAYDRIRKNYRNGLAVVTVERDACGGCFNKIPPQVQLEIGQRKKIIACEHCSRVLVDDHIMDVGKKPKVEEVAE